MSPTTAKSTKPASDQTIAAESEDGRFSIKPLLKLMSEKKASDLFFTSNAPVKIKIEGIIYPINKQVLSAEAVRDIAYGLMSAEQLEHFQNELEIDFAISEPGVGRFRAALFYQRGYPALVLRYISVDTPKLDNLGLPDTLRDLAMLKRGLVLMVGATGSGKSTTLAAMIDDINNRIKGHIVTIEDPIEFLHKDKKSFVTQREVDVDTRSFAEALRGSLRQDPDVILVGEMRDLETIETALVAAETGHLVLSTLHTLDAQETLTRILSAFPPFQQKAIRIQLAGLLKAVVSQRLMKSAKGNSRVPAVEVLISTPLIRDYILHEEKTASIRDAIAAGTSQYGMQTFDQSLFYLYQSGLVTLEEALRGTTNPDEFRLRLAGIQNTSNIAREEMEQRSGVGTISDMITRM